MYVHTNVLGTSYTVFLTFWTARNLSADIRAVQFTTTETGPFTTRTLQGVIGPWNEHPSNLHKMDSFGLKLVESNRKVEISRAGIYFIYSQVCFVSCVFVCGLFSMYTVYIVCIMIYEQVTYPSESAMNSYSINLISVNDRKPTSISVCRAPGDLASYEEVSCYTSIARALKPKDIIYLEQVEHNAYINMESKSTYFGIILLNGLWV